MNRNGERVNHPEHYNWVPNIECLDVAEHFTFNLGNALKYIWRAPTKGLDERIIDLRKAEFYIAREIAFLTKES